MFIVRKALNVLMRPLLRMLVSPGSIRRMRSSPDPDVQAVAGAISEALDGTLSREEREVVERIEGIRTGMLDSSRPVNVTDFGAGTSSDSRSEEEMLAGISGTSTVGEICRSASKRGVWSLLLFKLIRHFKPTHCLEMGTSLGLSCSYQASALSLNGGNGRIITMEGAREIAAIAEENLLRQGLSNATVRVGRFADTLEPTLKELAAIDYAFIDGHHDRDATLRYFEQIKPYLADTAILVFDDVYWTAGMRDAWNRICRDDHVALAVDLYRVGICLLRRNVQGRALKFTVAVN